MPADGTPPLADGWGGALTTEDDVRAVLMTLEPVLLLLPWPATRFPSWRSGSPSAPGPPPPASSWWCAPRRCAWSRARSGRGRRSPPPAAAGLWVVPRYPVASACRGERADAVAGPPGGDDRSRVDRAARPGSRGRRGCGSCGSPPRSTAGPRSSRRSRMRCRTRWPQSWPASVRSPTRPIRMAWSCRSAGCSGSTTPARGASPLSWTRPNR